jgi:hypothetical protein
MRCGCSRQCPVTLESKVWKKPYIIYICNSDDLWVNQHHISNKFTGFKQHFQGYSLIWLKYEDLCENFKNLLDLLIDGFKIRTQLDTVTKQLKDQKTEHDEDIAAVKEDYNKKLANQKTEHDKQFEEMKKLVARMADLTGITQGNIVN